MASKKQSPKTKVAEANVPAAAPVKKAVATKSVKPAAEPAVAKKAAAVKAEVKTPAVKKATKPVAEAAPSEKATAVKTTKVTFTLPKEAVETAETVALFGDFNNWDASKSIALKKQKDGSFATSVELEKGRAYQYRFLINGETWENAWNADAYAPTPFGEYNSVISVGWSVGRLVSLSVGRPACLKKCLEPFPVWGWLFLFENAE